MSDPVTIVTYAPQPQTVVTNAGPAGPAGGDFDLDSAEVEDRVLQIVAGQFAPVGATGVSVLDNGDGTLTLTGSGVVDNGDGTLTLG